MKIDKKHYKQIAKELQERLAATLIDYFKEHPDENVDEILFSFDDVKASVEFGSWHPSSDSIITLWNWNDDSKNYGRTPLITYG